MASFASQDLSELPPMRATRDRLHVGTLAADGSQESVPSAELFRLVYRQMRSLTAGRAADLDDLVQAALENVLRSLPSFEGRSEISTFTYRICYLTLLKNLRWYKRWLRRFSLTSSGELPEPASAEGSPDNSLVSRERSERLRHAVQRLSPKRRAVVILHDFEGVPIERIADIVQANALTVRSRLRDGRRDLGTLLEKDPYFASWTGEMEDGW